MIQLIKTCSYECKLWTILLGVHTTENTNTWVFCHCWMVPQLLINLTHSFFRQQLTIYLERTRQDHRSITPELFQMWRWEELLRDEAGFPKQISSWMKLEISGKQMKQRVCVCVCLFVCTCVCVCVHACMCVCMHTCMPKQTHFLANLYWDNKYSDTMQATELLQHKQPKIKMTTEEIKKIHRGIQDVSYVFSSSSAA